MHTDNGDRREPDAGVLNALKEFAPASTLDNQQDTIATTEGDATTTFSETPKCKTC
jgi:hypothetical protein